MITIPLSREIFTATPTTVVEAGTLRATATVHPSGIASLTIANERGSVEVLPYMGQIIWDLVFDGISLRMDNLFSRPRPATEITATYGCFAFHSGLLAAGCPAPDDDHPLHGEFPCAPMDAAWIEIEDAPGSGEGAGAVMRVVSSYEYVMGFGAHYRARPSVALAESATMIDIALDVTNLSAYAPMPLQYMCHMNYAFMPGGAMRQTLPDGAFQLRRTIPAHVTPTPEWRALNEDILAGRLNADSLEGAEAFDPEIVYFADDLPRYGKDLEFELASPDGRVFTTRFSSEELPVATRWILHNPDQKVAAFVLPGTSRPEGRNAAREAGTLIELAAGQSRSFHVTTGLKEG